MSNTSSNELLIGAHTSAAGGVHKALLHGAEIGATTIQLFTANQKQWVGKPISEEEIVRWRQARNQTGIKKIMSHAGYLINLGSPTEEGLRKSREAFREEITRCLQLELDFLNFHPGAALDSSPEKCLETIIASIKQMTDLTDKGNTCLLLEMTAGQGSSVGHKMEQIGYLIQNLNHLVPIGVCIDTCHIFAAGYDIRDQSSWDHTLAVFEEKIGLDYLKAFHVNDSIHPLGSHKDRHAHLGEGAIGIDCFKIMMQDPRLRAIPKYLETRDPSKWPHEIQLLRKFSQEIL